ncbi:AraC family transcriptional regulator [Kineococcus sp. GCM10028916]|uniref:AraC family transcriptional regulator n=1 Tax=Kineococcus sp. GCM10028916 TaxID=3273394 RepID=UPI00364446B1
MYDVEELAANGGGVEWTEAFQALHGAHDVLATDADPASAPILVWQASERYRLARCGGAEHSVARGPRHVRSDPRGTFELFIPLRGQALVSTGGETAQLAAGAAALCDLDRPLRLRHGAGFDSISLILPHSEVSSRERRLSTRTTLIDTTRGLGAVVRQLAVSLHHERSELHQETFDASCDGLLDLAALAGAGADTAPERHRESVAESVRSFVRAHAHEHDLDVHRIAGALGWSPRHVQGVLQAEGTTCRDLIRTQRLELARARLRNPQWSDVTVADIASACGFSTHSSFATSFRAEFGTTPTALRQDAATPLAAAQSTGVVGPQRAHHALLAPT